MTATHCSGPVMIRMARPRPHAFSYSAPPMANPSRWITISVV